MAEPGLLLIRGLGHSGSTILDLALGAHTQVIGLGEAVRVLDRPRPGEERKGPQQLRGDLRFERRCTCGELAADCPVWGTVLAWLQEHDDRPLAEKFNRLIQPLSSASTRWIVDSFQADEKLLKSQTLGRPLRVIQLTRDVRSWVHSESRRGVERRGRGRGVGCRSLLRWWRVNRRLDQLLEASGHSVFRLGYEELALAPELALRRLCGWLDLDFDAAMLQPGMHSTSHIVSGNRMRFESGQSEAIRYDAAWMASSALSLRMAPLLTPVARLNRRLVYSNGLLGDTWPCD
ncbi:MAG: sulfotransferase [Cyanobacteriota bacterium]|nr:sulfotransferase [Cyanobacteriota bacterium]